MLTSIREKAQGVFAWIILVGITVPFALWGIQNYFDGGKEQSLVTVGDKDFTGSEISQAINQFRSSLPESVSLTDPQIKQQAIARLIQDEALFQHVKNEKLIVSDATAREFIKLLPYFQVDGAFDKQRYEGLLKAQGLSSGAFVARIKKALTMQQYQQGIVNTALATDQEIERFYALQDQTRSFNYAILSAPTDLPEPSEEQIQAYYQAHQELFFRPETLTVEYVELSRTQLAENVTVKESDLKAFYEEKKTQFTQPEKRKLSHILIAVNDDRTADDALAQAQSIKSELSSKTFSELAKEYSEDLGSAKSGGELGWMEKGLFVPEFEQAAEALSRGDVSEPIKTQFGYHLITVTELQPEHTQTYEQVKAELEQQYRKNLAENLYFEQFEQLTELAYEHPENLSTIAEKLDLAIKSTSPFTRNEGQGPAAEARFRQVAFGELVMRGENSDPIEPESGLAWVVRKKDYQPAEQEPLTKVLEQVTSLLKQEQARRALSERLSQIKQPMIEKSTKLVDLAKDVNAEYHQIDNLKRNGTEVTNEIREAVFSAQKPVADKATVFTVTLADGRQALIELTQVVSGKRPESNDDKENGLKQSLALANGQAQYNAAISLIQDSLTINTSKKLDEL